MSRQRMRKPFRPIPQVAYDRFRGYWSRHIWVHYLCHCTICLLRDTINGSYRFFTPRQWLEKFG